MPLIDLNSNLTNLKFGNDRPGGGDSGLPYIKTYLPQNDSALEQLGFNAGKYSIDFPIRGGAKAVTDKVTDTIRITKFFGDLQRGPFFIAKQVGLQLTNPRSEVGSVLGSIPYTQVYLPTNTLAQVGVQGSGLHFDRPGVSPNTNEQLKYAFVVNQQNVMNTGANNRLLALYNTKIVPNGYPSTNPDSYKKLGIDPTSQFNLFKYNNGPGSLYGLGDTLIPRISNTTPTDAAIVSSKKHNGKSLIPLNYSQYIEATNLYLSQSHQLPLLQSTIGYIDGVNSLNNRGQQTGSITAYGLIPTSTHSIDFATFKNNRPVYNYNYYLKATEALKAELKNIKIENGFDANNNPIANFARQQIYVAKNDFSGTSRYPTIFYGTGSVQVRSQPDLTYNTNILSSDFGIFPNQQTALSLYNSLNGSSDLQQSQSADILANANDPNFSSPSGYTFTYNLIKSRGAIAQNSRGNIPQDFRKILLNNDIGKNSLYSYDYPEVNIQKRIGVADSGLTIFNRSKITNENSATQDKVTMTPLDTNLIPGEGTARDLVKFCIEAINNDNPANTTKIHFRSYVEGFSDNHSANWSGFQYTGRGDTFYNYQGFTREVAMNFALPALSRPEMKRIYQKANYLASLCYPDYNSSGLMRGNITLLTFGDYLYRCPGILKSVSITIPDDVAWEIAMDEPEGGNDVGMYELPHMLKISLAFTPIMSILPRRGAGVALITRPSKNNKFLGEVAAIK